VLPLIKPEVGGVPENVTDEMTGARYVNETDDVDWPPVDSVIATEPCPAGNVHVT
jgi:hypothetical protein